MEDTQFEDLWEQEERRGVEQRLQREYPRWRRRSRTRRTALACVAVVLAALSPLAFHLSPSKGYDNVYCNRSGIADAHWANTAGEILTRSLL